MEYESEKIQKIVDISRMYYEQNLTQNEIAKALSISRPSISKMLAEAKTLGIVKITISSPLDQNEELLDRFIKTFNLRGGLIVHGASTEKVNNSFIINESASYISEKISKVKNIGLGWGKMISSVVSTMKDMELGKSRGEVCPLLGNSVTPYEEYHSDSLVRDFGKATGFIPRYIYSPAFFETKDEKKVFFNLESQKKICNIWNSLDIAIVNIDNYPSVPDFATALRFGKKLSQSKAVGHMISYYYNIDGKIIKGDTDYTNHIEVEDMKKIKEVIGICGADTSVKSVVGALNTGIITHLIIDEELAKRVLDI